MHSAPERTKRNFATHSGVVSCFICESSGLTTLSYALRLNGLLSCMATHSGYVWHSALCCSGDRADLLHQGPYAMHSG
eukprot:1060952-Heterocapsa_arctica.AAC.1